MKDLITFVDEYIRKEALLPAERVVIGVSAGADSMALLYVLVKICKTDYPDTDFMAAHLNHGIRGEEADQDEDLVRSFCEKLGVPLSVRKLDIPAISKEKKTSVETQGRLERYAFFSELCGESDARIAVAHHMDDQAESIVMHIFRGCGMEGLLGMQPRNGDVIRPFLNVRKSEILEFCKENNIPYREDRTNSDPAYARNFWRNEIFPRIDRGVHMSPVEALNGLSSRIREENDYLEEVAERTIPEMLDGEGAKVDKLLELPRPILRRVLRKLAVSAFGDVVDMEACHWDAVMEILDPCGPARSLDLPRGRKARLEHGILCFTLDGAAEEQKETGYFSGVGFCVSGEATSEVLPLAALPIGEIVNFSQSFVRIRLLSIEKEDEVVYNDTTWFFPESALEKAVLRTRREGDTLKRAGSSVTKELRRFMTEVQFPVCFRDRVLLVMAEEKTLWFPGFAHAVGFTDPLSRERYGDGKGEKLYRLEFLPEKVEEGGL